MYKENGVRSIVDEQFILIPAAIKDRTQTPKFYDKQAKKNRCSRFFFFLNRKASIKKKKSFICFPNHLKKYVNLIFRYSNIIDLFYRH